MKNIIIIESTKKPLSNLILGLGTIIHHLKLITNREFFRRIEGNL